MLKLLFASTIAAISMSDVTTLSTPRPQPLVFAHRGASFDAPENTLASFRLAWEQGADGIEGDFYLTADGKIITLHDATFKRTAGVDRKPADMTLEEIRKLDVGKWKDASFTGEPAPLLSEVLAIVPAGKKMLVEVKCGPEILPALKQVLIDSKLPLDQVTLICFNANVIAEAKKLMPDLTAFWLTSFKADDATGVKHPTLPEMLSTLRDCHADGIDAKADFDVIDEAFVKAMKDAGHQVHFWTVDEPAVANRLASLGALSITTNKPAFLRASMGKDE